MRWNSVWEMERGGGGSRKADGAEDRVRRDENGERVEKETEKKRSVFGGGEHSSVQEH